MIKFDLFIKMNKKFNILILCNNQLHLMFTADGYLHFYRVTITNTGNEIVQVIGRWEFWSCHSHFNRCQLFLDFRLKLIEVSQCIETVYVLLFHLRQWKIESLGETEDIQRVPAFSPGLIGLKPVLEPGQMFEYTSCVTVKYKQGIMEGSLLLINKSTGDAFEAVVKPFLLLRWAAEQHTDMKFSS